MKNKTATILVGTVWVFGYLMAGGMEYAHANNKVSLTEMTVDGIDYPVCAQEDCSDQPDSIGVWLDNDTGNWYFSTGDESFLVIDDTTQEG